ncbi:hypothetical protein EON66_00560 [archaeon]|nr:MAG: hypothetical protein EON66_00560 [archaeon]
MDAHVDIRHRLRNRVPFPGIDGAPSENARYHAHPVAQLDEARSAWEADLGRVWGAPSALVAAWLRETRGITASAWRLASCVLHDLLIAHDVTPPPARYTQHCGAVALLRERVAHALLVAEEVAAVAHNAATAAVVLAQQNLCPQLRRTYVPAPSASGSLGIEYLLSFAVLHLAICCADDDVLAHCDAVEDQVLGEVDEAARQVVDRTPVARNAHDATREALRLMCARHPHLLPIHMWQQVQGYVLEWCTTSATSTTLCAPHTFSMCDSNEAGMRDCEAYMCVEYTQPFAALGMHSAYVAACETVAAKLRRQRVSLHLSRLLGHAPTPQNDKVHSVVDEHVEHATSGSSCPGATTNTAGCEESEACGSGSGSSEDRSTEHGCPCHVSSDVNHMLSSDEEYSQHSRVDAGHGAAQNEEGAIPWPVDLHMVLDREVDWETPFFLPRQEVGLTHTAGLASALGDGSQVRTAENALHSVTWSVAPPVARCAVPRDNATIARGGAPPLTARVAPGSPSIIQAGACAAARPGTAQQQQRAPINFELPIPSVHHPFAHAKSPPSPFPVSM